MADQESPAAPHEKHLKSWASRSTLNEGWVSSWNTQMTFPL